MIPTKLSRAQTGASLVEILVGLAIGLVILTAIGTAYVNSNNSSRQREDQAQLNDPARNVLRTLQMNLMQAGYVDIFDIDAVNRAQAASLFVPGSPGLVNVFVRDPAVGALTSPITQFFPGLTPVFGCDGAMASSPNALFAAAPPFNACGAGSATRHTLQVAYQATANNAANAANSLFAANANTGDGLDCLQQPPPAGETMVINRFSAPVPAAGADSQLRCEGSGGNAAQDIAAGVEEFVLRYQMSAPGLAANRLAAGAGQERYISATEVSASAQGWAGVTAVEICIVAATPVSRGPAAQGTVNLQPTRPTCTRDATGVFNANIARAAGDARLWKRYTSVVSLRNAIFATPL
jgi:type IV pilus assembly protein PilW